MAFVPRAVFPTLDSLPRSYYLGHHAKGLAKMRSMLSQIDIIIECRDYRVPLTSRNPQFEESLAGKERVVVYTKKDLGIGSEMTADDTKRHALLRSFHAPSRVLFSDDKSTQDIRHILSQIRTISRQSGLTGTHLMVVGMPNVGKSSLLNALRREGIGKGKAAITGAHPGVTRKVHTSVKIIDPVEGESGGVYLVDTPGVFIPYVPDSTAMLKLALCGSVGDNIIPFSTLVDYLLFQINLHDPKVYGRYHAPTNDAMQLLEAIARQTGRLRKGGEYDLEGTAQSVVQRWRSGQFGHFLLDEVTKESLERHSSELADKPMSGNQLRKASKEAQRKRKETTNAVLAG